MFLGYSVVLHLWSIAQGGFTIPGTISACAIDTPIPTATPANPLGIAATSAPTALSSSQLMPVVHWFGYVDLRKNPPLLDRLIRVLGEEVGERFGVDDLCMFVPPRSQASLIKNRHSARIGARHRYAW